MSEPTEPMRAVIARHGLSASKALGQNFILDRQLLARVAAIAGPLEGQRVYEVGPGPGGLTYALLRNSWYFENYTAHIPAILQRGSLAGSTGDGRVSAATRADYAAAAAAVLTGDGHEGRAYELGGDEAFTLAELAAEIGAQAGQPVGYLDLPEDEYARLLAGAGLPEAAAVTLADADRGLARGDLFVDTGHLRQLIGRPTSTLHDAVAAALG